MSAMAIYQQLELPKVAFDIGLVGQLTDERA